MSMTLVLATLKRTAILGLLLLSPAFAKAQAADSKAINDMLKEARTHAVRAVEDAEKLESYTRSVLSWQSHGVRLTEMQGHANDLINDFNKLKLMRSEGSPWQQEAIDRIDPLLREMGDHLKTTIDHLNENKHRLQMPPYREYAKANLEVMSKTNQLISDFVDYAESKTKAAVLEKGLDLPVVASDKQ